MANGAGSYDPSAGRERRMERANRGSRQDEISRVQEFRKDPPKKKTSMTKTLICCGVPVIIVVLLIIGIPLTIFAFNQINTVLELQNVQVELPEDAWSWQIYGNIKNVKDESLDISKIDLRFSGSAVDPHSKIDFAEVCDSEDVRTGVKTKIDPGETLSFSATASLELTSEAYSMEVVVRVYHDGKKSDAKAVDVEEHYTTQYP